MAKNKSKEVTEEVLLTGSNETASESETIDPVKAKTLPEQLISIGVETAVMKDGVFESHKQVLCSPMNRLDYNVYRGWDLPEDENGDDAGYLVEYLDGGEPNHPWHSGYISWSPKAQFDNGYEKLIDRGEHSEKPDNFLCFSEAISMVMKGRKMKRRVWSDDKGLIFKNGQFCIISDKRGTEVINHFDITVAMDNLWVEFDEDAEKG